MTRDAQDAPGGPALRLMACDAEDLAVISAHLQDAILRVGDMIYLPREKRFVIALKRFDWLAAGEGGPQRAQSGLHFERVGKVAFQGFRLDRPDDILNLLNVEFIPADAATDAPGGAVLLIFSGGCAVRLEVECLEARMADLGPRWRVRQTPGHQPE